MKTLHFLPFLFVLLLGLTFSECTEDTSYLSDDFTTDELTGLPPKTFPDLEAMAMKKGRYYLLSGNLSGMIYPDLTIQCPNNGYSFRLGGAGIMGAPFGEVQMEAQECSALQPVKDQQGATIGLKATASGTGKLIEVLQPSHVIHFYFQGETIFDLTTGTATFKEEWNIVGGESIYKGAMGKGCNEGSFPFTMDPGTGLPVFPINWTSKPVAFFKI